jgi:hypothetical protein
MLSTTLPFPLSVMVSLLQMDSRVVSRSIKNEIWPLLRKSGFSAFSARTAWRFAPEQTHVVNFQSFNTYLAERLGCTTVSFGLNLGIYFTAYLRTASSRAAKNRHHAPRNISVTFAITH